MKLFNIQAPTGLTLRHARVIAIHHSFITTTNGPPWILKAGAEVVTHP